MTETSWTNENTIGLLEPRSNKLKYYAGGAVLLAALVFLIANAVSGSTQLFITVDEFYADQSKFAGRDLRVSGWVLGDSIQFTQIDSFTSQLEFDIVDDFDNPGQRLRIVAMNEPMPDLLQDQAQAMVEGRAAENGDFTANAGGLLLKCPTRYEELETAPETN